MTDITTVLITHSPLPVSSEPSFWRLTQLRSIEISPSISPHWTMMLSISPSSPFSPSRDVSTGCGSASFSNSWIAWSCVHVLRIGFNHNDSDGRPVVLAFIFLKELFHLSVLFDHNDRDPLDPGRLVAI